MGSTRAAITEILRNCGEGWTSSKYRSRGLIDQRRCFTVAVKAPPLREDFLGGL
jgi:hypothetical protein